MKIEKKILFATQVVALPTNISCSGIDAMLMLVEKAVLNGADNFWVTIGASLMYLSWIDMALT